MSRCANFDTIWRVGDPVPRTFQYSCITEPGTSNRERDATGMNAMPEPTEDPFPPTGVNLEIPNVARVYDYYLGGRTNYAIDRELADQALATFPQIRSIARANRQFLFRAVRHLMRLGVRQYIDLGAGLPTMDSTHSVADSVDPGKSKVVYVDNEPVAVAHSQVLLEEDGDRNRHTAINADIRAPDRLWHEVLDTQLIDLSRPVAVLLVAVLHFAQLDEHGRDIGPEVVSRYRELMPPGSYLVLSHGTRDGVPDDVVGKLAELRDLYSRAGTAMTRRSHAEIKALFGDFELIPPGLVWTPEWHPEESATSDPDLADEPPSRSAIYAAIGRKP